MRAEPKIKHPINGHLNIVVINYFIDYQILQKTKDIGKGKNSQAKSAKLS